MRRVPFDATKRYWQFVWINEASDHERTFLLDLASVPAPETRSEILDAFQGHNACDVFRDISEDADASSGPDFLSGDWCPQPEDQLVVITKSLVVSDMELLPF